MGFFVFIRNDGAAACLFQLLILLQAPVILYFMAKWLPRFPKQALLMLIFQVAAAVSAVTLIVILEA